MHYLEFGAVWFFASVAGWLTCEFAKAKLFKMEVEVHLPPSEQILFGHAPFGPPTQMKTPSGFLCPHCKRVS